MPSICDGFGYKKIVNCILVGDEFSPRGLFMEYVKVGPIVNINKSVMGNIDGVFLKMEYGTDISSSLYGVIKAFGGRWDKANRVYRIYGPTWPYFLELVRREMKRFESGVLLVDPYVREVAHHGMKHLVYEYRRSGKTESDLDVPHPKGLVLYGHQKAVVEIFNERGHNLILADEMGTGKTISATSIINYNGYKKVLIVCPDSLKNNWLNELKKWLVHRRRIAVQMASKPFQTGDIVIINFDLLSKFEEDLSAISFDFLIVDEAHNLKSTQSKRFKTLSKFAKKIPHKLLMTGTPILNRPIEVYALVRLLGFRDFGNKNDFGYRYCDAKLLSFNNRKVLDLSGSSNERELAFKLKSTVLMRRTQADIFDEIIDVNRYVVPIMELDESSLELLREYEKVLDEVKRHGGNGRGISEYSKFANNVSPVNQLYIDTVAKIRKAVGFAKLPFTIQFLSKLLTKHEKVVVFGHHREILEAIVDHFGKDSCVLVYGGMNADVKQEAVDRFNNDPSVKLFVGSITVGGVGFTLTTANVVVFCELDWVPSNIAQCEARCVRIGQTRSVDVYYLVAEEHSIDMNMIHKIEQKKKNIKKVVNF
jgi:SWI/SNF-related matrix-associated actin-dependent regulator 1 of chromatin subfamily A